MAVEGKNIAANMMIWQDNKLFCLEAQTGRELWRSMEPKGYINNTYLSAAEGKVFVRENA